MRQFSDQGILIQFDQCGSDPANELYLPPRTRQGCIPWSVIASPARGPMDDRISPRAPLCNAISFFAENKLRGSFVVKGPNKQDQISSSSSSPEGQVHKNAGERGRLWVGLGAL